MDLHLHILQLDLSPSRVRGHQQHRQRGDGGDAEGDGGEEAEDGLGAVEGGVHVGGKLVGGIIQLGGDSLGFGYTCMARRE
jgi:hypothetical protein